MVMAGWGSMDEKGIVSNDLKVIKSMKIIREEKNYSLCINLHKSNFCASLSFKNNFNLSLFLKIF